MNHVWRFFLFFTFCSYKKGRILHMCVFSAFLFEDTTVSIQTWFQLETPMGCQTSHPKTLSEPRVGPSQLCRSRWQDSPSYYQLHLWEISFECCKSPIHKLQGTTSTRLTPLTLWKLCKKIADNWPQPRPFWISKRRLQSQDSRESAQGSILSICEHRKLST